MKRGVVTAVLAAFSMAAASAEPDLLTPADENRYREVFDLQEAGKMSAADAIIAEIENPILLGYVLEQRYMHPTAYRSKYSELSRWLNSYADHPNAAPVYRLALKRRPSGARPQQPVARRWRTVTEVPLYPDLQADYDSMSPSRARAVARIEGRVRYLLAKDRPTQALSYINDPRQDNLLTPRQTDRIRGWIAESYYLNGKLADALRLAEPAAERSGPSAVMAHWTAGIVHWRRGDQEKAYHYFSRMADVDEQETSLRAASAFWAARAALATGRGGATVRYLDKASAHPLTLYGQLALGQLGRGSGIDWTLPPLTDEEIAALIEKTPRLERAIALAEVGLGHEAALEIRWAQGELPAVDDTALLALATELEAASAQVHISEAINLREDENRTAWAALYPAPQDLEPNGGFEIDKAVLFGLIRQESKFSTQARSRVGAAGLMQVMPRTASYVANDRRLMRQGSEASKRLYDPGYNMQLGQSYVEMLLTEYNDGRGDMFEMALSYNWGPGNFRRWNARNGITDQLLMLESIPNKEARHFVDVVMTNIWVYRDRLGEPAPTRDAAAAGERPIYKSVK